MISHVHVGVDDFERAFAFYSAVLPVLGLELKFKEPENGWAGWMTPGVARPLFLVGLPFNRQPASPGNGQMIALLAPDRAAVDRCHARGAGPRRPVPGRARPAPALSRQLLRRAISAIRVAASSASRCHQPEPT